MIRAWLGWTVVAIAVVAAVLGVWFAPMIIDIGNGQEDVICEPFMGETTHNDLWPYIDEIKGWVESTGGGDQDAYLKATIGMLDRCSVARQNREVALMLIAIAGATILILTRPRSRAETPPVVGKPPTQSDVD